MGNNRKNLIFLISVPLVAVMIIFMVSKVKFGLSFSPVEQKVLNFNDEQTPRLLEKQQLSAVSAKNPIDVSLQSEQLFPETSLTEVAPPPSSAEKKVSFILINQKNRWAIIEGKFVHEGDVIDKQRIAKIEKNKVLLKGKEGEKWLKLD